jgi:hypothetical protein
MYPFSPVNEWWHQHPDSITEDYSNEEREAALMELYLASEQLKTDALARRELMKIHAQHRTQLIAGAKPSGSLLESIRDIRASNNSHASRSRQWGADPGDGTPGNGWHQEGIVQYAEPDHSFSDADVGFPVTPWCDQYVAPGSTALPELTLLKLSQIDY